MDLWGFWKSFEMFESVLECLKVFWNVWKCLRFINFVFRTDVVCSEIFWYDILYDYWNGLSLIHTSSQSHGRIRIHQKLGFYRDIHTKPSQTVKSRRSLIFIPLFYLDS